MYRITCNYGGNHTVWTRKEAFEWLAVSGPDAKITHRFTGRLLAARTFNRSY